ncbi:hypothetical protein SAMN05421594_4739 [Chryseobacterium oleae]|uniref:Uncharacterized protein n=1 Tax=Chryseobacterium oleae TaxID=491207 RepID=A0A1I5D0V6_CHROL|nr:DUF6882 domain-containing protein [Chryseobacterium oleae]SFN92511.1 hypothetical protein SAMN05421594_4739 [Chryseobacterium oleae]
MNYKEFSQEKLDNLIHIQDLFKKKFDIDGYENWFYDSESELLRLYNSDEDEIYFRYIPVGSYSQNKQTWMWSWFNENSIEKSKEKVLAVKEFGAKNQYEKLLEGTFTSDKFDAWEFTSICLDFLNGIGAYKVDSNDLDKFMVIMAVEDIDSKDVQLLKQKTVECVQHGYSRPAFVCQHLDCKTARGFQEAFDTYKGMELEEDDDFQAWCDECEKVRIEHGEWNEESESFAQIQLICENCYFELKEFNQKSN